MRYFTRLKVWKASDVIFNPESIEAYSYDWWCFVKVINGKVVFNNYNYSPSTIKHQIKVRRVLETLGIKIDLIVECPKGLQASDSEQSSSEYYSGLIIDLKAKISNPRSQAKKNAERELLINDYVEKCITFKNLVESRTYNSN